MADANAGGQSGAADNPLAKSGPTVLDVYGDPATRGTCPECMQKLEGKASYKHAVSHYGEEDITPYSNNLTARQRRAFLLGLPIPSR